MYISFFKVFSLIGDIFAKPKENIRVSFQGKWTKSKVEVPDSGTVSEHRPRKAVSSSS